jgi:hypothetical protein
MIGPELDPHTFEPQECEADFHLDGPNWGATIVRIADPRRGC